MIRIDVLLVTYNSAERIAACMSALHEFFDFEVDRIIVVDNASSDGSLNAVIEFAPSATIIRNQTNVGFARAVNQALRLSDATAVALVNPDISHVCGSIDDLLPLLEQPDIGAVAVRMVDEGGSLQRSCHRYPDARSAIGENLALHKRFPNSRALGRYRMLDWDMLSETDVEDACGGFLFLTSRALSSVGPFDERFFMYYEETDWLRRAATLGFRAVFTPVIEVVHSGGGSSEGVKSDDLQALLLTSMYLYMDKWYGWAVTSCTRLMLGLLELLRLIAVPFRADGRQRKRTIMRRLRIHFGGGKARG